MNADEGSPPLPHGEGAGSSKSLRANLLEAFDAQDPEGSKTAAEDAVRPAPGSSGGLHWPPADWEPPRWHGQETGAGLRAEELFDDPTVARLAGFLPTFADEAARECFPDHIREWAAFQIAARGGGYGSLDTANVPLSRRDLRDRLDALATQACTLLEELKAIPDSVRQAAVEAHAPIRPHWEIVFQRKSRNGLLRASELRFTRPEDSPGERIAFAAEIDALDNLALRLTVACNRAEMLVPKHRPRDRGLRQAVEWLAMIWFESTGVPPSSAVDGDTGARNQFRGFALEAARRIWPRLQSLDGHIKRACTKVRRELREFGSWSDRDACE